MEPIGFIPTRKQGNRKQRRAERPGRRELSESVEQAVLLWQDENFDSLVLMFLAQLDRIPDGYDRFLLGGFAELAKAKADEVRNQ